MFFPIFSLAGNLVTSYGIKPHPSLMLFYGTQPLYRTSVAATTRGSAHAILKTNCRYTWPGESNSGDPLLKFATLPFPQTLLGYPADHLPGTFCRYLRKSQRRAPNNSLILVSAQLSPKGMLAVGKSRNLIFSAVLVLHSLFFEVPVNKWA